MLEATTVPVKTVAERAALARSAEEKKKEFFKNAPQSAPETKNLPAQEATALLGRHRSNDESESPTVIPVVEAPETPATDPTIAVKNDASPSETPAFTPVENYTQNYGRRGEPLKQNPTSEQQELTDEEVAAILKKAEEQGTRGRR